MKNAANAIIATLTARNEVAPSKDLVTAANNATRAAVAIDKLFGSKAFHPIADKLIKQLAVTDKKSSDFIAVKVAVKIVAAATGLGRGLVADFDGYSTNIINNIVACQKITNKDALVSLSRAIEYDENEVAAHLVSRGYCSPSTATTQASSTRMMLRALDICEVQKGKRGDVTMFKDNDRAQALISLFAAK